MSTRYDYTQVPEPLSQMNGLPVKAINLLPPKFHLCWSKRADAHKAYTIIHHNAHYNISSLLNEEGQRTYYDEDTVTIVVVGDYPETLVLY